MSSSRQKEEEVTSSSTDYSRPCPKNGYYDVFLSFRGEDTRYSFTHNLYRSLLEKKVHTFMDVKLTGEDIDYLFNMVAKSRMAVVIYSESFASSDWCLRELEMILQRRKVKKMWMIPIFYKVDVHELKHLSGKTAEYFNQHIKKHDETVVQKWKDAVTTLGNVSGISYKDRYEYDFIREVIVKIKEKLEECEEILESCVDIEPTSNDIQNQDNIMTQIEEGSASDQNIKIAPIPNIRKDHIGSSTQSVPHTEAYRVITSGYFQKSEELTGKLLNIKPKTLFFYIELEKESSSCLILSNKTDYGVAFKIECTPQPLKYRIFPSDGIVLPHTKIQVIVTMDAQYRLPPNLKCTDKLIVWSLKAKHLDSTVDISSMLCKIKQVLLNLGTVVDQCSIDVDYNVHPSFEHLSQLTSKGLVNGSWRVTSIDTHPTKPWLLLGFYGSVCICNHETMAEEKSFKIDSFMHRAKFIHEKNWIVVGSRDGFVRIFDYDTSKKVREFKAHRDSITCVTVHPTLPYVLTTSVDKLIKLWNWENDWARRLCEFEGHSSPVMQVAFNPKDCISFASASSDKTIKIWSFSSPDAKFTIDDAHAKRMKCVEYFVGNDDKLNLLSGSYGYSAKVWDYESKNLVKTLEGHSGDVEATLVHPKLPIIITGSIDKTIRIWNKNTYRLELVWKCDLGEIWNIGFIKASDEVVLGCEDGIILIKIVDVGTRTDNDDVDYVIYRKLGTCKSL